MPDDHCELLCLELPRAERIRERLDPERAREAATHARALGDPTRLSIVLALRDGEELCVCDLAWIVAGAENLVGHHLSALRDAGLADSRRDGQFDRLEQPDQRADPDPPALGATRRC